MDVYNKSWEFSRRNAHHSRLTDVGHSIRDARVRDVRRSRELVGRVVQVDRYRLAVENAGARAGRRDVDETMT